MNNLLDLISKLEEVTGYVFNVTIGADRTGTINNIVFGKGVPFENIQGAFDIVKAEILKASE